MTGLYEVNLRWRFIFKNKTILNPVFLRKSVILQLSTRAVVTLF